jgi:hypothetical protein
MTKFAQFSDWIDDHADLFVQIICHRITRLAASWVLVIVTAVLALDFAWHSFDESKRNDGNYGHSTIDFGGQWMMGAMLVQGHGRQLYNRDVQRGLLEAAYPKERQDPTLTKQSDSDASKLMSYVMGSDERRRNSVGSVGAPFAAADPFTALTLTAGSQREWYERNFRDVDYPVGGPLYPPINAFVYAPLGMMPPHVSYRVNQLLNLLWVFVAALGVQYLLRGHVVGQVLGPDGWLALLGKLVLAILAGGEGWLLLLRQLGSRVLAGAECVLPLAAALIIVYPGFKGSIHLGQNATMTLAILIWGWALIARDRPWTGGLVWGLLAFKPVWAAAFFLVPLFTFRLRTCLAMLATGIVLAGLTLPFVGFRPWSDWLVVGGEAAGLYKVDSNWIFLSRDLLGIPRRWLVDFQLPYYERDNLTATLVGWALVVGCLLFTVVLALLRPRQARAATGTMPGFLLLGAWLSCFHFMYYDVLLTALPMFVLLAEPRRFLEPILVAIVPFHRSPIDLTAYYDPWPAERAPLAPVLEPSLRNIWVLNRAVPSALALLLAIEHGFPQLGIGASVTSTWWTSPLKITTSLYEEGQPWDTLCILALWLWCGIVWLRTPVLQPAKAPIPSDLPEVIPVVEAQSEHITQLK